MSLSMTERRLLVKTNEGISCETKVLVKLATTFLQRLIGLLSARQLSDYQGLIIAPCSSIHTFGMRFTIDVVFLDKSNRVIGYADSVRPNRIRMAPKGGEKVLEIAEGNRSRTGINLDDYLIFD